MVFSFFKKSSDKNTAEPDNQMLPQRRVARPKPPGESSSFPPSAAQPQALAKTPEQRNLADLDFSASGKPALGAPPPKAGKSPPAPGSEGEMDKALTASQFDREFTDSSVMDINVTGDDDPLQADVEQAAVLFANGQDKAARAVLEACARAYQGADGLRLWRMLLDLVQIQNDRAAFETLGEEFVKTFEISPPAWRLDIAAPAATAKKVGPPAISLQGVVTEASDPQIVALTKAVEKKQALRLDLGKLASCDDDAMEAIMETLRQARKDAVLLSLENAGGYIDRLCGRLVAGERGNETAWQLALELLQRQGRQEMFEEKAVDYAITFEVSPPSWDATATTQAAVAPAEPVAAVEETHHDEAHHLSGEIKNSRFEELEKYLEQFQQPVVDFSQVKRMDFFSVGQLRNLLEKYKEQGKDIVIRNPHHLVAELMGVIRIQKVARIIVPKN